MTAEVLTAYLAFVNVVTFVAFCVDKRRAVRHEWRISEATLLGLSFVGGSLGALVAMRVAHHKTRKPKFYVGVPAMLVVQVVLVSWLLGL